MNQPESRVQIVWSLSAAVLAGVLAIITVFVSYYLQVSIGATAAAGITVFLAISVFGVLYNRLRYQRWGFEMRDEYLYLEHGVVRQVRIMVPYVRVQHIDTQRGVFDRLFNLSSLVVYTAGSRGADVQIPGLSPAVAAEMQEALRDIAIETDEMYGDAV